MSRWLPPRRDLMWALALLVAMEIEVLLLNPSLEGPRVANAAIIAVIAASVAFRNTRPFLTIALLAAGAVSMSAWVTPVGDSLFFLVVAVMSSFAVGMSLERRPAIAGLVLLCGLVVATTAAAGKLDEDPVTFPIVFFIGAPWLGGRAFRARTQLTRQLEERTRQLERDRELRAEAAVAEDRAQIARELHDLVAHSLSVMVVQAGGAQRLVTQDPERAEGAALMIETTGREALTELRRLLGVLRRGDEDLALAPTPSIARVDRLVARTRDAGLRVELRIEGEPAPLATVVDLAAYRIVQEALTNTIQHSGSAHARVIVRYEEDEVEVEVSDTGTGPHPGDGDGRDGHGLIGMRERVALVGGELEVGRRREGGFAVRARLPRDPVTA